jgi:hypothetical protein
MQIDLLVRLAARLRTLSEEEFAALRELAERGNDNTPHLTAVSQALIDCIDISEAYQLCPRLRLVA